jgi:hypothetical protein
MTLTHDTEHPIGLRQMLAIAEDEAEIRDLISQGGDFSQASEKTRRSWKATARRRLATLAGRRMVTK